jgi:hypothetical protein
MLAGTVGRVASLTVGNATKIFLNQKDPYRIPHEGFAAPHQAN